MIAGRVAARCWTTVGWRRRVIGSARGSGLYANAPVALAVQRGTGHAQIQRLTMVTPAEGDRGWPRSAHYWHVVNGKLVNFQQQRIFAETQARHAKASAAGQTAARRRWQGRS
jgi:hypothetical protein